MANVSRILWLFFLIAQCLYYKFPVVCHIATVPSLVVVAFDGFRWDYLKDVSTPNFDKFMKEGVHARRGIKNVFETFTLPNFWTLTTGLYPESHGVVENQMYDPVMNKTYVPFYAQSDYPNDPKFFDAGAEPIWTTNQRQNNEARSGTVMWVGEQYFVKWSKPTFYVPFDEKKDPRWRVDKIVEWFVQDEPINLGMLYFQNPDFIAHNYGPDSDKVTRYIEEADKLVGYIMSSLKKHSLHQHMNIIITSDHGLTSVSTDKVILLDDVIPHDWYSRIVQLTPVLSIIPMPDMEDKLYQRMKEAADKPSSHFKVWKKEDIPERFHYKHNIRVTPIVALADLHYNFNLSSEHSSGLSIHGYDNEYPEMHPFFMAKGPSFKEDYSVESFNSVDVYPLMCHLLHLQPAPNNGSMYVVSKLLATHETTLWTFVTYIFILIFVSCVGGIFTVCACRQHRYLKRMRFQNKQLSFQGGIKYSVPTKGTAVVKLLSDDDDDYHDDDDDCVDMLSYEKKRYKISH